MKKEKFFKDEKAIKNDGFYNLNKNLIPGIHSYMTPKEKKGHADTMEYAINTKDLEDGKAKDIDMGFHNNGLK